MPTLGTSYYPRIPVTEAVSIVTDVENAFRGSIKTSGLASHLGMAEDGGAFANKLTSLHRYGVLAGRGTLTVTALGQRIAHPASALERNEAIREAFLNIDLFRRLHERLGTSLPSDGQFRIVLEEVSGAERRDVAAKLTRIRRLYEDGARFLSDGRDSPTVAVESIIAPGESPASVLDDFDPSAQIVLTDGQFRLPVERSVRGIRLLRKYIDLLEEQLGMETEAEENEGDPVG